MTDWPRFVWKLLRGARFGEGGDGGDGSATGAGGGQGGGDPGSDPGTVGAPTGGDPGQAGTGDAAAPAPGAAPSPSGDPTATPSGTAVDAASSSAPIGNAPGAVGSGAAAAALGAGGAPTAGAPSAGGDTTGIMGLDAGQTGLTQSQQSTVNAINAGTFAPSPDFNFGADVGKAIGAVNPDTLSGAAPPPPGFSGPVSSDPAVLAAAGLGNVPGFPSVGADTPLSPVSVPAVTGTPAAIGAPGAPDIGSIGTPAPSTPTGAGASLPATANDPFGLESGGIVPGIGLAPGDLGPTLPATLSGGVGMVPGDLGPNVPTTGGAGTLGGTGEPTTTTAQTDPTQTDAGFPHEPGSTPPPLGPMPMGPGSPGWPDQGPTPPIPSEPGINWDNLTIDTSQPPPPPNTGAGLGGGDTIRLLSPGGGGGLLSQLLGQSFAGEPGGIELPGGSVVYPNGVTLSADQIAGLQQQQDALLQQWAGVIPMTDPRWPQVQELVIRQIWGPVIG